MSHVPGGPDTPSVEIGPDARQSILRPATNVPTRPFSQPRSSTDVKGRPKSRTAIARKRDDKRRAAKAKS